MITNATKIFCFFLFLLLLFFIVSFGLGYHTHDYIKSKYGKYCYIVGQEHGNIEYPIIYKNLEDCLKT